MNLKKEFEHLLNRASRENESNTPDFILANYLMYCLEAGEDLIERREEWYGKGQKPLTDFCTCGTKSGRMVCPPDKPVWVQCGICKKEIKTKEKWCSCEKPHTTGSDLYCGNCCKPIKPKDLCTCIEPRPLPMYWVEGQDVVCKCMKVIPKDKLAELKEKLKKEPIKLKENFCYAPMQKSLPIEPLPPLAINGVDEDVIDNREKINEVIRVFGDFLNKEGKG